MPLFEAYFVLALLFHEPTYIVVFPERHACLAVKSEYDLSVEIGTLGSHIKVSLNQIAKKLYPSKDLKPKFKSSFELNESEIDVLYALRNRDIDHINIIRKNGKVDRVEIKEYLDPNKKLGDLLKEHDFQDIEIKVQNGKITSLNRKVK